MEENEENSTIAAFVIRETPTKACNTTLKNCRCCNSSLAKVFDSVDLFGKTAKKENIEKKLKEIGAIEVSEEDVGIRSTKVCRKCFRKISGLGKAVHAFRDMCLKSKQIHYEDMSRNTRQKRGRNPCSPAQENREKRIRQSLSSEFAVRHFDANTENSRSMGLRVRTSLFPSEELILPKEILPLPSVEKAPTTSTADTPQASEILKGAGLRNPEVGIVIISLSFAG